MPSLQQLLDGLFSLNILQMIDCLRKSLLIFIALLQFVAPLVHAHASGMQGLALGIHVPGLEFIAASKDLPGLQAQTTQSDSCGTLIGVSCGVQQGKTLSDLPVILSLYLDFKPLNADFIVAAINFSPQANIRPPSQSALRPIAPRAPPSLPFYA